ncbi:MAG: ATP-binding protein [Actinomycetota bacterium]|nr:ATP-binding protein [Actinomycetota bacterium]
MTAMDSAVGVSSEPPELAILVGLQASGKTTFRERLLADHVVVSKDLMGNARRKEERQRALVRDALAAGSSVVVDNTNPEPAQRLPLIAIGRELGARVVAYYFETTLRDSFRRNTARTDKEPVPRVGLLTVAKRLTPPAPDEGFDEIRAVRVTDDEFDERRVHPHPRP